MSRQFYVYILASRIGGTIYVGVTNDLVRRIAEHKSKEVEGFTLRYGVDRLVYFEGFDECRERDPEREAAEEMAARMEDQTDRAAQSGLE